MAATTGYPPADRSRVISRSALVVAFAACVAAQTWLIFAHSPWFDEVHALQIARAPLGQLSANLKYEGQPGLWYLWLRLVDTLDGRSIWTLALAQLPVAVGLQALIWLRAPLAWWVKALLTLSYLFGFEYAVLSRSYGLGAALILAAVAWRGTPWAWLMLALAANTSVHAAVCAVAVGGVLFFEQRSWRGVVLLAAGLAYAAATVFPVAPDLHPTTVPPMPADWTQRIVGALRALSMFWIPNAWDGWSSQVLPEAPGAILGLATPALGVLMLWRQRPLALGFVGLWAALGAVGCVAYSLSIRHVGYLSLYMVIALWIRAEKGESVPKLATLWLTTNMICGIGFLCAAVIEPFTPARAATTWIARHGLQNARWGAWGALTADVFSAAFDRPVVNIQKGCVQSFTRWDYNHWDVSHPAERVTAAHVQYVLIDFPLPIGHERAFFLHGLGFSGDYRIYELDAPPGPVKACR